MHTIYIEGTSHWFEDTLTLTIASSETVAQTMEMTVAGVTVKTSLSHTRELTRTIKTTNSATIAALKSVLPVVGDVMKDAGASYEEVNAGEDLEALDIEYRHGHAERTIRLEDISALEALKGHRDLIFS